MGDEQDRPATSGTVRSSDSAQPCEIRLGSAAVDAWDDLTGRPARHLPGLARLNGCTPPWEQGDNAKSGSEADGTCTQIPNGAAGIWRVTTRSSEHLLNLDAGAYMRIPDGGQPLAHDARWCQVTRVDVAPQVGGKFFLWFDDPESPDLLEHWRQSSTISRIEPVDGPA